MKINTEDILENTTEDEILRRTTEYDIYSYYMPKKFIIGKVMSSPFRNDSHPSFGIFKANKTGSLLFKDQGTGEVGNCFKFVSLLYNISHKETIEKIWKEVVLKGIISTEGISTRDYYKNRKIIISIKRKNFTKIDDDYWSQYYITRDILKKYNVFPIQKFWINENISKFNYTEDNPIYAYKIFNSFKIYMPKSKFKKDKWRTNCNQYDVQGWDQLPHLGDTLVITKSLKDIMVLSLFGIPSIAPHGEGMLLPRNVIESAKKRFKRLVMLYDYDDSGEKGCKKMQEEYDIPYTFIPKHFLELYNVKDVSDYIKEFGKSATKKLLKELFK